MPGHVETRRRSQARLLKEVCERRARARIGPRRPSGVARLATTRMIDLREDELIIEAPTAGALQSCPANVPVEIFFEDRGDRYVCHAETRGAADGLLWPEVSTPPLRVTRPLRVMFRPLRRDVRIEIEPGVIKARMNNMLDRGFAFELDVTNISSGGIAGIVAREVLDRPGAVGPFWVTLDVPGETECFEAAVRPTHCTLAEDRQTATVGWAFCAGDDDTPLRCNLDRLADVAERFWRQPAAVC